MMPLPHVDLVHGQASPKRLKEALENLSLRDIPQERKDKIEAVLGRSRFQRVYVEYFLAPDPVTFREQLPSNQAFLQQAQELGLNQEVLQYGIPDRGITLSLKPNNPAEDIISEFSRNTLILFANSLARLLAEEFAYFPTYLEERAIRLVERTAKLFEPDESIRERGEEEIITYDLIAEEGERYQARCDRAREIASDKIRVKNKEKGARIIEREKNAILGNFHPFYHRYHQQGQLTEDDLRALGVDISQRGQAQKFVPLLNSTCSRLLKFADGYPYSQYSHPTFPSVEFMDFADNHLLLYRVPFIASRLRGHASARYFLQKEPLLPEDVVFANDAGSCIAIYAEDIGKGTDIPFYQLDLATPVLGMYQELIGKKPTRVGFIPAFATINSSRQPVLLENSLELSQAQNPLDHRELERLVIHATTYFTRFARTAGFTKSAAGIGDFNTGKNYLSPEWFDVPDYTREELVKLPDTEGEGDNEPPEFYSQVFTTAGFSKKGHWAYLKL